ncbi:MAG TPA: hypothetical protein VMB71_01150 [Acetobacteraceae bacterium]|nr:hypothetical protein [Acetobacteraceae bacterium]
MRRLLLTLVSLLLAAAAEPGSVSTNLQQSIVASLGRMMVLPQTTVWQFDWSKPGPAGGTLVCGHVNYQDSTRHYLGLQPFFAIVRNGKVAESGIQTKSGAVDPTGAISYSYDQYCGNK